MYSSNMLAVRVAAALGAIEEFHTESNDNVERVLANVNM